MHVDDDINVEDESSCSCAGGTSTTGDALHGGNHGSQILGMEDEEFLYDLSDLFGIFADTTRIKMLYALKDRNMSVSELAETVGVSQSAASHQLRTLKQARLVKFRKDGKNVYYSLCDDHVTTILEMGIDHLCE